MPKPQTISFVSSFVSIVLCTLAPSSARAEISLDWSGRFQSDIRFRVEKKAVGGFYDRRVLEPGVARNENTLKLRLEAEAGDFFGVADLDFVWLGIQRDVRVFDDLFRRETLDSYRLEAHALYVEATDVLIRGLDLRVGQQKVSWGKGDQFNPTNTLNALDIEDPLLFGELVANTMIKLDYTPGDRGWTFSAVLVPVFKPALLPWSSDLGLAAVDRLPFVDDQLRWRIHAEQSLIDAFSFPTVLSRATIVLPERRLDNMQAAFRVAGTLAEQDIALSYFVGHNTFPRPFLNYSTLDKTSQCDPTDPKRCIAGRVLTEVSLGFPKMQVIGLNAAGQINPLGWISRTIKPLGYRIEAGLFFPRAQTLSLLQDELDFGFITQPAGEYDYGLAAGRHPETTRDTPFAKWVVGLDYTFNRHLYLNAQWIHGFPDEFGAGDFIHEGYTVRAGHAEAKNTVQLLTCATTTRGIKGKKCAVEWLRPRLGDYLVIGFDIKLLDDKLLSRLFMIFELNGMIEERYDPAQKRRVRTHYGPFTAEAFTAVIFPELTYTFGHGFEMSAGALLNLGRYYTKFGEAATGGSKIWTRARFSF